MAKILTKEAKKRKRLHVSCDPILKDEFDSLKSRLENMGKTIDLTDDFEKVLRAGISEMKKVLATSDLPEQDNA